MKPSCQPDSQQFSPQEPPGPKTQGDESPPVDVEDAEGEGNGPQGDDQVSYDSDDSIGDQFGSGRGATGFGAAAGKFMDDNIAIKLPPVTETEFYSNLVFLSILSPTLGPRERRAKDIEFVNHSNPEPRAVPPGPHAQKELQRDFLDRLCYLADFKKGGDSITAAAIQFEYVQGARSGGGRGQEPRQRQQPPPATQIIWFAANAGLSAPAWDALREVERLIQRNRMENLPKEMIVQEISERFILLASCEDQKQCCDYRLRNKKGGNPKGTHRINFYSKEMRKYGKKVREWLLEPGRLAETTAEKTSGMGGAIETWIDDLRRTPTQLELVERCYSCWYDEPYKSFLNQAKNPESRLETSKDLEQFAHYVARLGAHKYAALKVAAGIKQLSYMNSNPNFFVKFDKLPRFSHQAGLKPTRINLAKAFNMTGSSEDVDPPLSQPDPWNIIHKLSQYFPGDGPRLAGGYLLEEQRRGTHGGNPCSFRDEIQKWLQQKGGVLTTRYHAELQVANFFNAMALPFQDHDRYIGCSKSACWFCFQYLRNLRPSRAGGGSSSWSSSAEDGFVEPSCHNQVLPGVSFPPAKSEGSKEFAMRMMAKMNDVVLNKIREVLLGSETQFSSHHQSTNTWMNHTAEVAQSSRMEEEDNVTVVV